MLNEALEHVERHAMIDQAVGERVAQVMEPEIGQTHATPDAVPGLEQRGERLTAEGRGKMRSLLCAARGPTAAGDGCPIERNRSELVGFWHRHQQLTTNHVQV